MHLLVIFPEPSTGRGSFHQSVDEIRCAHRLDGIAVRGDLLKYLVSKSWFTNWNGGSRCLEI